MKRYQIFNSKDEIVHEDYFNDIDEVKEWAKNNEEADYFARCLLMPKEKFVELFEKIKYVNRGKREADKINPISCLSSLFDVPVKQVIKRIEELDLKL